MSHAQSHSPRPILVMHGDHDTIIPYTQGVKIYDAAQEPKRMWLVKGGSHCQLYDRYPAEYEEKVDEILQVRWCELIDVGVYIWGD